MLRLLLFLIVVAVFIVFFLIKRKIQNHIDDGIYYGSDELKKDAKIIDIKTEIGNSKDPIYITKVTFDDGFVFVSRCCDVEKHNLYNRLTLTSDMKQSIVNGARLAHLKAMGLPTQNLEYEMSSFKYKCGTCGRRGPYDGNCPDCGSSLKVADK